MLLDLDGAAQCNGWEGLGQVLKHKILCLQFVVVLCFLFHAAKRKLIRNTEVMVKQVQRCLISNLVLHIKIHDELLKLMLFL